jgi:hypothetical protein
MTAIRKKWIVIAAICGLIPCAYLFKLFYFTSSPDQIGISIPQSLFFAIPFLTPFSEPALLNALHGYLFPTLILSTNLVVYAFIGWFIARAVAKAVGAK